MTNGSTDAKVRECIQTLERGGDEKTRFAAVEALWEMGEAAAPALPILVKVIKEDPNYNIRSWAEGAVVRVGKKALPTLLDFLKDTDSNQRSKGAYLLGELAQEVPETMTAIITELLKVIRGDPDYLVRYYTIEAVGRVLEEKEDLMSAVATLGKALRDDENKSVREAAAKAMVKIRSEMLIPEFLKTITEGAFSDSRWLAADAFSDMKGGKVKEAVPALCEVLRKDPSDSVRSSLATALGRIGGKEAVAALIQAIQEDEDDFVRSNAIQALWDFDGISKETASAVKPVIEKILREDKSESVRETAKMFLGFLEEWGSLGSSDDSEDFVDSYEGEAYDLDELDLDEFDDFEDFEDFEDFDD